MRTTAHRWFQYGLDLFFPPHCAGCQRIGHLLCPHCLETMRPLTVPLCQHCGTPLPVPGAICAICQHQRLALDGLRSLHLHQGPLRSAIHALKYIGQQRLAEPLGQLLAEAFTHYGLHSEAIIPLPLHVQRQRERGFNQACLLARICAERLRLPCLNNFVIRQRATRAQVGLNAYQRRQNVAGAFALAPGVQPGTLPYRSVLLIDDVCTTGATLEACAALLYSAGLRKIQALVLAQAVPDNP